MQQKAEWRFAIVEPGEQCVMTSGILLMLTSCADNLVSTPKVIDVTQYYVPTQIRYCLKHAYLL